MTNTKITYTKTDEAPALATYSWLPIVRRFLSNARIEVELADISLAGRIIASFPDHLNPDQRIGDELAMLGEMTQFEHAMIIKIPNISASVPQLHSAIRELQSHGYNVPDYPENPGTQAERSIKDRYGRVLGSAVNPVLREGNSDRRVADAVKNYAKANPHPVGAWSQNSRTRVAHMRSGDFYGSENAAQLDGQSQLSIELESGDGSTATLHDGVHVAAADLIATAVMSCKELKAFCKEAIDAAMDEELLFSLHLKTTMMKVSDPIMFGHFVEQFYETLFKEFEQEFHQLNVNPANGLSALHEKIQVLDAETADQVRRAIAKINEQRPPLAMVNSDKGISNLHVPSDIIVDASMAAAIRSSGQMWGPDGKLADILAVIPDRCYARMYQTAIEFCQDHGAFDPKTMGNVCNIGLMAKKAEEYGSHDTTFEIETAGIVRVKDGDGVVLTEHAVDKGDIWRMCLTRDIAVRDWVKLAVRRCRQAQCPAIFWLDRDRAYDKKLIENVEKYLDEHDTAGLDIRILAPVDAMAVTLMRVKAGKNTISVTGNVLRDYLTDLFPVLEIGTSARMMSIVPLLCGGAMYESGAGGSAPKHVQQFTEEGHLRWDSLGEFLALAMAVDDIADKTDNARAAILASTLGDAAGQYLLNNRTPSRNVGEIDNRGGHFYLAMYWARALADQKKDAEFAVKFESIAARLEAAEGTIVAELAAAQGEPTDVGGYFHPDDDLAERVMRPSDTFNQIVNCI